MSKRLGTLNVLFTLEERAKVSEYAQSLDLDDGVFVRALVLGSLGKVRMNDYVDAGVRMLPKPPQKRAAKIHIEKFWKLVGDQHYTHGPWVLLKIAPKNFNRRWHGAKDPSNWYHLFHTEDHSIDVTLAFEREPSMKLAMEYIERHDNG